MTPETMENNRIGKTTHNESPQQLFEELLVKVRNYHPSGDLSLIEKAYATAAELHKNQVRKSGEPYIVHPLYAAHILAELEMDKETIAAGLLHDVDVCVEGVEEEQFLIMKKLKVNMIQGFYFDKPMKLEAFEEKYL